MKRAWLAGLGAIALTTGCGLDRQARDIVDVTKPGTIILTKAAGQGHVHSLSVKVVGEIQGDAEISLQGDEKPYRTQRLSGAVSLQWQSDWYSDAAELRYVPSSVTGGRLRVTYEFRD